MVAAPTYAPLSPGLYKYPLAEVLARPFGSLPSAPYQQLGDMDAFTLNVAATTQTRMRKNASVRTEALRWVTATTASLSMTAMQHTDLVRAAAILGAAIPFIQSAAAGQVYVADAKPGIYLLPDLNVTAVTFPVGWTEGEHYRVVDEALGGVEILAIPGAYNGPTVEITYGRTAVAAGAQDQIRIGANTRFRVELIVRDLSNIGRKERLVLHDVTLTPNGDQAQIATGDDLMGIGLSGSAADTANGIGFRQFLAA